MKPYNYKSTHFGFQVYIPDSWSGSFAANLLAKGEATNSKTILGPDGKYLNILITPLQENEHEPTIKETREYFEGLTYRQNLNVIATGTINIENKEHFWATYYRMTFFGQRQLQFYKKYSLFLNRTEYLITAMLWDASISGKAH